MSKKYKIALVGCGRISRNHFAAIDAHKERLELTAVCDIDKDALTAAQTQYQVPGFLSMQEMLSTVKPDLVTLCTPSGLHPMQTIEAARAKINVITEKPMATKWQDGIEMVKVCREENTRLFVVKQNRLNPTLQHLKKAIDDGRFGKIYMINVNVFWTRPQDYYSQAAWRGTFALDGGAFMNQASHYIDLAQWLLGPVESVQAMTATLARKIEAEDSGVMNLKWRHGALGSINVTMLTYPQNYEGSITILGEKGTAEVGGIAVNEILHWDFQDKTPEDELILSSNYKTESVYGIGHPLYYANVIDALDGKAPALVDGQEGLRSLELLIAAYKAARDKATVSLPLEL